MSCVVSQGKIHLTLCVSEKLVFEGDIAKSILVLSVRLDKIYTHTLPNNYILNPFSPVFRVKECYGLGAWGYSGLSDPVCQVTLLSNSSDSRPEVRRGQVHKRTVDPVFFETFDFPVSSPPSPPLTLDVM